MTRPGRRSWRLSLVLAALLFTSTTLTFLFVGAGVLLWRLPALDQEHRAQVAAQVRQFVRREELLLQSLERQLQLIASALHRLPATQVTELLDEAVGDGAALRALAVVGPDGRQLALGLPPAAQPRRRELLAIDVSTQRTFLRAREHGRLTWGATALSAITAEVTLGVAIPLSGDRLLLAEVPLSMLLTGAMALQAPREPTTGDDASTGDAAPGSVATGYWIVDGNGEVMADSDGNHAVRRLNLLGTPVMASRAPGLINGVDHAYAGTRFHMAAARSASLDWTFVARVPAGMDHPRVANTVAMVVGGFVSALLIGAALAPLVSRRLVAWLQSVQAQAKTAALRPADARQSWRPTPVAEFNLLAERLTDLALDLSERERELQLIFNAAPVPMAVSRISDRPEQSPIVNANDAWCRLFGYRRSEVLGRTAQDLQLWGEPTLRARAQAQLAHGGVDLEGPLRRADGRPVLCHITGHRAYLDERWLMIWSNEDVTDRRRIEQELRDLNQSLEQRVNQRTQALAEANETLRQTLDSLQRTQDELLRSEKLAALGSLVAGVAHELNTPLGNALMAVTTLRDDVRAFRDGMAQGLRRAALDQLLQGIDQATTLSSRNLERAADLVSSFKQVAVDQTSSQRRAFELAEVVQEIVLTLKPSFNRTPYTVEVDVPAGLRLDSYPGALGQVLANLITNARVHAFEGRTQGRIGVQGWTDAGGQVCVEVSDDGNGIPSTLIDRVFDPFVTTRMGRGGTGLGLHIAHNAATRILGGTLTVTSTPGLGTRFLLRLPAVAPVAAPAPAAGLSAALAPPAAALARASG